MPRGKSIKTLIKDTEKEIEKIEKSKVEGEFVTVGQYNEDRDSTRLLLRNILRKLTALQKSINQ